MSWIFVNGRRWNWNRSAIAQHDFMRTPRDVCQSVCSDVVGITNC
jgi:hypothetical protein